MVKTRALKRFDRVPPIKQSVDTLYLSRKKLSADIIDLIVDETLMWCIETFGNNDKKEIPNIVWYWNTTGEKEMDKEFIATYNLESNEISVKIRGHRTAKKLIRTIIHEYIHYLQPTKGGWYERWNNTIGYSKNPYEIEAYYLSDLYENTANSDVMKKIFKLVPSSNG